MKMFSQGVHPLSYTVDQRKGIVELIAPVDVAPQSVDEHFDRHHRIRKMYCVNATFRIMSAPGDMKKRRPRPPMRALRYVRPTRFDSSDLKYASDCRVALSLRLPSVSDDGQSLSAHPFLS